MGKQKKISKYPTHDRSHQREETTKQIEVLDLSPYEAYRGRRKSRNGVFLRVRMGDPVMVLENADLGMAV